MKFGLTYRVTIQVTPQAGPTQPNSPFGNAIVIEPPLTINFNIHRSVMSALNVMTLQIYNLSIGTRNSIFQDRFDINRYKIVVEMGYVPDGMAVVFIGDIFEANSTREGANVITTIQARDGGFDTNQSTVSTTLKAGQTLNSTCHFLAAQFPNLRVGKITDETPGMKADYARPIILEGATFNLLKQYVLPSGLNQIWIDLEIVNITGIQEVIFNNNLLEIDASTGLINTPQRDNSFLTVTTLLEPRAIMGQSVAVKSSVLPQYNGVYKIVGVTHKGIISAAVESRCQSEFNMNGNALFGPFRTI